MALTSVIFGTTQIGGHKMTWGSYDTDSTGGDITTGLDIVYNITITPKKGSTAATNQFVVNETFPLNNGGKVTIVTDSAVDGYWRAIGE